MIRLIILFITLSFLSSVQGTDVFIVPKPKEVKELKGSFNFKPGQVGLHMLVTDSAPLKMAVADLQNEINLRYGFKAVPDAEINVNIRIGLPENNDQLLQKSTAAGIWPEPRIKSEGYVLRIQNSEILIIAGEPAGLFYGIQTLKQIIRGNRDDSGISCLHITDWPDLEYRGMQDDISRGPVPTLDYMKLQVRRCAEMKLNLLSYYIEHVVKTQKHGDFAPADGSISIEQWQELDEYAKMYFVQLMGNFQSLGHFEKIMAFPQYRHLGETDRMISPVLPESIEFLENIYTEMLPAFSAPFFNVNCDEVWDLGRGPAKEQVENLGVARVYANHILRLNELVKKHNRRLMIWGDIVLEHPELFGMLDKDIVQGTWNYSASDSFDHLLKPFHDSGFDFMFSCGVLNSNRIVPDYQMTFKNIKNFNRDARKYNTLGMLNTVWDDGGTALFSLDWYGVAYGADHSWNSNEDGPDEFNLRFDHGIYGIQKGQLGAAFQNLSNLSALAATQEMNEHVLWEELLPERMRSLKINLSDVDAISDIADESERMLDNLDAVRYKTDREYIQFVIDQYKFIASGRKTVVAAANSYNLACFNQNKNADSTRKYLDRAIQQISSVKNDITRMSDSYQKLWLQENQIYWLDHIIEVFNQRITKFNQVEKYLAEAKEFNNRSLPLLAPNEIRLAISETKGRYFQFWLLCGPFPNIGWKGRETDYLKSIGGELAARPIPGTMVESDDGKKFWFKKYPSPVQNKIELDQIYQQNTEVVAYAYCRIESPDDRKVRATLGSNDGIRIVLNGENIYENFKSAA